MDHGEFLQSVRLQTHLEDDGAARAVRAVLSTLAERLSKGEARDLLEQLPAELKPVVYKDSDAEAFGLEEFLRRVAEREGADRETAERHARAVFWTLGRALTAKEVADIVAELPEEFAPFLAEAEGVYLDVLPADEFVQKVAGRAGVDRDTARRATEATLETVAERIAGGEVRDLVSRLPVELHPPLHRAKDDRAAPAQEMTRDEFVNRIARREGTDFLTAVAHARAVLATLREAVGEEYFDLRSELPPDYWELLGSV